MGSLLPRESTPSGSVAPSWLLFPPSRRCGSPSRSTMRPAPALSTASASRKFQNVLSSTNQHHSMLLPLFPFGFVFFSSISDHKWIHKWTDSQNEFSAQNIDLVRKNSTLKDFAINETVKIVIIRCTP